MHLLTSVKCFHQRLRSAAKKTGGDKGTGYIYFAGGGAAIPLSWPMPRGATDALGRLRLGRRATAAFPRGPQEGRARYRRAGFGHWLRPLFSWAAGHADAGSLPDPSCARSCVSTVRRRRADAGGYTRASFPLRFRLRFINVAQPVQQMRHRAGRQNRELFPSRRRTRPAPILGPCHQAGAHRVAFDVTVHRQQMIIFLDRERSETALPDVAAAVVMLVLAANVGCGQPHHVRAQVAIATRPQEKMKMIPQQAKRHQADVDPLPGLAQQAHEGVVVPFLVKDRAAGVATVEDVVAVAAQRIARRVAYRPGLGNGRATGKINVPCPLISPRVGTPGPSGRYAAVTFLISH
jgi:hypothetical protein